MTLEERIGGACPSHRIKQWQRSNPRYPGRDDDPHPARDSPVRNPTESSSPSTLDSDVDMDSEEPGSLDDEAMEEIVMYDELSPIPITKALPQVMSSPEDTPSQATEFVDQQEISHRLALMAFRVSIPTRLV